MYGPKERQAKSVIVAEYSIAITTPISHIGQARAEGSDEFRGTGAKMSAGRKSSEAMRQAGHRTRMVVLFI